MKKNVMCFIAVVLSVMAGIGIKNVVSAPGWQSVKWTEKSFLYNMDFASRWTAAALYPFGISTDPTNVIVGTDGWLFLGDAYSKTISEDRRAPGESDVEAAKAISHAVLAWDAYLSDQGVKLFRIIVGPNKGTIYPEHMPEWAKPGSPNAATILMSIVPKGVYVDPRQALKAAKTLYREELYFRTDSHWNLLGAGVSFKELARNIAAEAPDLIIPTSEYFEPSNSHPTNGGDLTNFLRISSTVRDVDTIVKLSAEPRQIVKTDYDSKKVLNAGGNFPFAPPRVPTLVASDNALNDKKVLWLRDSFGNSQAPFMSATFSQTLQMHWLDALKSGGRFLDLIHEWKPDYVFITVVERDLRDSLFKTWPPVSFTSDLPRSDHRRSSLVGTNSLTHGATGSEFTISGSDASMVFSLDTPVDANTYHYMSLDLSCSDGSTSVPVQIFWAQDGMTAYDESHSVTIQAPTGAHDINLLTVPKWADAAAIIGIRVDLDPVGSCQNFKFGNPVFSQGNR